MPSEDASCQNNDSENLKIQKFASADFEAPTPRTPKSIYRKLLDICLTLLKTISYSIYIPFWRHHIGFANTSKIWAFVSAGRKKRVNRLTAFGERVFTYYLTNWLLLHLQKHIRGLDLSIEDASHAWQTLHAIWSNTFKADGSAFLRLVGEIRPRGYEDFLKRDREYFLHRHDLLTEADEEVLYNILLLTPRGNKFIRLLVSWLCRLLERRQSPSPPVRHAIENLLAHQNTALDHIREIRRKTLETVKSYAANMFRYTIDTPHGDRETSVCWNEVICEVDALMRFRPMANNLDALKERIRHLGDSFNMAARRTFVVYQSEQSTPASPIPPAHEGNPGTSPKKDAPGNPISSRPYGRFTIQQYETQLVVTDSILKYSLTVKRGTNAEIAITRLIVAQDNGCDQITHSDPSWKGVFQKNRKYAPFKDKEIFIVPRWCPEKRKYLLSQPSDRWRLWTDEELKMPKEQRIRKFIEEHPNGYLD